MTPRYALGPILDRMYACSAARTWLHEAARPTFASSWAACRRGDWLLWLAASAGVDPRLVVLAACDCAEPALIHVPAGEDRPRLAIETSRRWARGKASLKERRAAASAAWAAAARATAWAARAEASAAAARDTAAWAAAEAASLAHSADLVRARIPCALVEAALIEYAGRHGCLIEIGGAR